MRSLARALAKRSLLPHSTGLSISTRSRARGPKVQLDIAPDGWKGPRGNFAPAGAHDQYLDAPPCENTLFTTAPGLINLDTGAPCSVLLQQAQRVLHAGVNKWATGPHDSFQSLQYGPTVGSIRFRTELASFLARQYGEATFPADSLFQTNGATQGLIQCLNTFFGRTALEHRVAFVEDPTYFLAPKILAEHGFSVHPVPVCQQHGLDLDRLEESLMRSRQLGQLDGCSEFAGLVYCIPSHHNPTGAVMPAEARVRLVQLAREYRLLVVADDVYELLYGSASSRLDTPRRLVAYDREMCSSEGYVIGNGTFSKILAPGIRTGWIEAADNLIGALGNCAGVSSSGANNQTMGSVLAEVMAAGMMDQSVAQTSAEYALRREAVAWAFKEYNTVPGCTLSEASGGMCLWLTMPDHFDSHQILIQAREAGVSFKPGDLFSSGDDKSQTGRKCCRIVVAHYDSPTLIRAMKTLCGVLSASSQTRTTDRSRTI